MSTLKDKITEVKKELGMRRQVWQRLPGRAAEFRDMEHNRRYKALEDLLNLLEEMTEREFLAIQGRITRREEAEKNSASLFDSLDPINFD